jgi:hypothetical protein
MPSVATARGNSAYPLGRTDFKIMSALPTIRPECALREKPLSRIMRQWFIDGRASPCAGGTLHNPFGVQSWTTVVGGFDES